MEVLADLLQPQSEDFGFAAAEFQGTETFRGKAVAGEFRIVHAVPEVVDGALRQGEDEVHAHFLRLFSGKFTERAAVSTAFMAVLDVQAAEFRAAVFRIRVHGHAAHDAVIQRQDVVVVDFRGYICLLYTSPSPRDS